MAEEVVLVGKADGKAGGLASGNTLIDDAGNPIVPTTFTIRIPHSFIVYGEIKVPSGGTDYIPEFYVDLPAGQTAKLAAFRAKIYSGTNCNIDIDKNGSGMTGFTSKVITTSSSLVEPTAVALADGDRIQPSVNSVDTAPTHLSLTLFIDYTITL